MGSPAAVRRAQAAADLAAEVLTALAPDGGACSFQGPRNRYFALRRAVAVTWPWVARTVPLASEVLWGPRRPSDDGAGALAVLDTALESADCEAARRALVAIGKAQALAAADLERRTVSPSVLARTLSEGAFELGLMVLQAGGSPPTTDLGAAADAAGLAEGLGEVAGALHVDGPRELPSLGAFGRALEAGRRGDALVGRGAMVVLTGELGKELRLALAQRGWTVPPPYPPLHGAPPAPVSALTLPAPVPVPQAETRSALGRRLFVDRRLSRGAVRSCSSCHEATRAFTDGRPRAHGAEGATLSRNTPTLLYAALGAAFNADGRFLGGDAQALHVVHAKAEMGLRDDELVVALRRGPDESSAFAAAFDDGLTATNVGRALAAYEALLIPGSAPVDRYAEGERTALSVDALAGLDVFAGKGRCTRCHVPPTFGGSRPTDFAVPVYAVLGVPSRPPSAPGHPATTPVADGDRGRAAVTGRAADEGAFKTPTLRNVVHTAPYFHHGAYATLDQVLTFYDAGGGRGLGLATPGQDRDVRPLHLTAEERRVLLVFLQDALTDAR